jgi:hypothetical protein
MQRPSRCFAEPGPTLRQRWTPDQQRTTPQARRAAQHPGHELTATPASCDEISVDEFSKWSLL